MRLKSLPQGWREKVQKGTINAPQKENSKNKGKSKHSVKSSPKSLRNQSYGSFEAILEQTEQGTYRIEEVLKL